MAISGVVEINKRQYALMVENNPLTCTNGDENKCDEHTAELQERGHTSSMAVFLFAGNSPPDKIKNKK